MINTSNLTILSLSGTFGILARLALNPKMPKEPSSPSRSDTRTERQCINNETNRQGNNKGQRTISGIKHWGLSGYSKHSAPHQLLWCIDSFHFVTASRCTPN